MDQTKAACRSGSAYCPHADPTPLLSPAESPGRSTGSVPPGGLWATGPCAPSVCSWSGGRRPQGLPAQPLPLFPWAGAAGPCQTRQNSRTGRTEASPPQAPRKVGVREGFVPSRSVSRRLSLLVCRVALCLRNRCCVTTPGVGPSHPPLCGVCGLFVSESAFSEPVWVLRPVLILF